MQPSIGAAVPVSLQPLHVPTVTNTAPQASVWPGVPGVRGQGAQLPPGGPPPSVGQLPPWGLHPGMAPPTAPAHGCIHPTMAPLGCSSTALESGAETMSADMAEDIDVLLTWISEVMSNADIPVDPTEIDDILTWISNEGTPSSAVPDDLMEIDSLLTWIAEASSCPQVPQQPLPDVPSSLGTSPFSRGAPDFPTGSRELSREAQADAGPLSEPFSGQPASSGQLSEPLLRRHLMEEARQRQPRVALTRLALPTPLDARVPPSAHSARLIEEAKRRQLRVVLTRLALPPGCTSCRVPGNHHEDGTEPAECPAPACTTGKGRSRGHEQRAGSVPARKRRLPLGQDAAGHKRRR